MILFWRDKSHTIAFKDRDTGIQISVPDMETAKEVGKQIRQRYGVNLYFSKAVADGLTRKSRKTGTLVTLEAHRDPELPWLLICEEHATTMQFPTKSAALKFMPVPDEWCEECR